MASGSAAAAATLRVLRRTLRLPQLQQGGTLSISVPQLLVAPTENGASSAHRLSRLPPLTVRIVPGWRDDAEVELWQQIFVEAGDGDGGDATSGGTDDLVVGMSATQNEEDGNNKSSTTSASTRSLVNLGKSSGDICLRLGLLSESAPLDTESSNQLSLDDDMDVQDFEVPVEIDDDDDDDDEEEEPSRFVLDDGEPNGINSHANADDGGDEQDDIFDPSSSDGDDHGLNSLTLVAAVPEKINLRCHLGGPGNIVVEGKVEGQDGFDLRTECGNIKVKKLRGDSVRLLRASSTRRTSSRRRLCRSRRRRGCGPRWSTAPTSVFPFLLLTLPPLLLMICRHLFTTNLTRWTTPAH